MDEQDKLSTKYFMTEMTQEEFSELMKGKEPGFHEFNKIKNEYKDVLISDLPKCPICQSPMINDMFPNCIWCEINKSS